MKGTTGMRSENLKRSNLRALLMQPLMQEAWVPGQAGEAENLKPQPLPGIKRCTLCEQRTAQRYRAAAVLLRCLAGVP